MIVSLGAYDRFNYGDLLFPLILDYAALQAAVAPMCHAALRRWDPGASGARPTVGISTVLPEAECVILGGGEIIGATWGSAAASILPIPLDLPLLGTRLVSPRLFDFLGRALMRGSWATPYVPPQGALVSTRLVASAIGASSFDMLRPPEQESVLSALRSAAYLSVRDRQGWEILQRYGLDAALAPDSVAVLPRLHDASPAGDDPGLVVQASRAWLRKHGYALASAVRELSGRFSSVSLLPIGTAGAHGDLQGLKRLRSALLGAGVREVRLLNPTTVWDIADAIASARLFIGTSLHGAITAMAYAVPFVPLAGIGKLDAYVGTWASALAPRSVLPAGLSQAASQAVELSVDLRRHYSLELDAKSWANLSTVVAVAYGQDGATTRPSGV